MTPALHNPGADALTRNLAPGRWSQGDQEFKVILSYTGSWKTARIQETILKRKEKSEGEKREGEKTT